jgi:hypothetical protein
MLTKSNTLANVVLISSPRHLLITFSPVRSTVLSVQFTWILSERWTKVAKRRKGIDHAMSVFGEAGNKEGRGEVDYSHFGRNTTQLGCGPRVVIRYASLGLVKQYREFAKCTHECPDEGDVTMCDSNSVNRDMTRTVAPFK